MVWVCKVERYAVYGVSMYSREVCCLWCGYV